MSLLWWIQIAADIILLGAVLILLKRLRSLGGLPRAATPADLESFLEEAQRLSKEFDRLLGEKRELVGTTLSTLDARISQLKQMAAELEARPAQSPPPAPAPTPEPPPSPADQQRELRARVLSLARQGKSSAQIAEDTGRPRGEVELILGLNR